MQKVHFDLAEIESSIRTMFATIPPAPADNPVAQLQGQMVELTVAFEVFKFGCANKGLSPDHVYPALMCWMGDRIADLCRGDDGIEYEFERQALSLNTISAHINLINHNVDEGGGTSNATGSAIINPVQSGTA